MSKDHKKEDFCEVVDKVRKGGIKIKEITHDLLTYGQSTIDLADACLNVTGFIDPPFGSFWQDKTEAWNWASRKQDEVLESLETLKYPSLTVSSTSVSLCVLDLANAELVDQWAVTGLNEEAKKAAEQLSVVLDVFADKNKLIDLITRYGLDRAKPGNKTPVELLETAIAAFEKPVSEKVSANTSLVRMRECCMAIILQLIVGQAGQK